jgi:hypothetical protein
VTYSGQPQELPGIVADLAERLRALEARFLVAGPTGPQGPAGPGTFLNPSWQQIGSLVVTAPMSPVATVSLPFVPAGAHHLIAFWKGRTSAAVTNQGMGAQFNSDSGANYYYQLTDSTNVTLAAQPGVGTNSMRVGIVPGANATAGLFGGGWIIIPNYYDSHYQMAHAQSIAPTALTAAGQVMETSGGFWAPGTPAPLNRLDISPAAGGFVTDSAFWFYTAN